jgi:hypothetical protein
MARVIDLRSACTSDRLLETARTLIVLLCAAALIMAGRAFPF